MASLILSDLAAPSLLGHSVALEVPGVVHHKLEVVVTVDAHGDVVVVLDPFALGDRSVASILLVLRVVLLESVDELVQDLVLSLLAGLHIGVHLGVVALTDVIDLKDTTSVLVHDLESFHGKALAEVVHGATDTTKELVVVDGTAAITIEHLEELSALLRAETNTEVVDSFLELLHSEVAATVIIRNLKRTAETHDTAVATLGELLTETVHQLGLCHVHGRSIISSTARSATHAHGSSSTATSTTAGGARATTSTGGTTTAAFLFALPALLLVDVHGAIKVPGVVDHQVEVLVIVDGGRHVVVVLNPLLFVDDVVRGLGVAH